MKSLRKASVEEEEDDPPIRIGAGGATFVDGDCCVDESVDVVCCDEGDVIGAFILCFFCRLLSLFCSFSITKEESLFFFFLGRRMANSESSKERSDWERGGVGSQARERQIGGSPAM